ncbi:hypothetical protein MACH26_28650 [Planctobacterium marinum]|uniref:GNAT family N-acetyltransferase n=1 Tax=Planctobacterium marinum TaxID=1631968 RepID=A0AA48HLC2_9ALTE|nr:hypothetical protein MACH26_28650 [Planctobacterium marinum]
MESSGSVTSKTGWQPYHLWVTEQDAPIACMPLYIKTHSYGEYVFDWSWAEAYQRYQLNYYPKLVAAIPFTPVTGPRLIFDSSEISETLTDNIISAVQQESQKLGLSSLHILFPEERHTQDDQWCQRKSVQFQWHNQGYQQFDNFLSSFASRKRKNLNKERRKVREQGIEVERFFGATLQAQHLDFFYQCYQQTYLKRSGHAGYLNRAFFDTLFTDMADNIMIVQAQRDGEAIAAALYFYNENGLYGRYWGALQEFDCLHFECCYYQGIEFAIEQQLPLFNPGTQGEHKIQRGFEPIYCQSEHWLANPDFNRAIQDFVKREQLQIAHYKKEAASLLPFKQAQPVETET